MIGGWSLPGTIGLGCLRSPHRAPMFSFPRGIALGLVAAAERDVQLALEQYAAVAPVVQSLRAGPYIRFLGIIAQAVGLRDQAAAHFEDALAFNRKGYRADPAWTCCDYADLLRERNVAGDGERAAALLEEGLILAREPGHAAAHGAHPVAARISEGVDDDYVKAPGIRCHALERQHVSTTVPQ